MKLPIALLVIGLSCGTASAQPASRTRFEAFGDIGYARTWDDEGLLGSGAGLSGGIGIRLTDRTTVQALVSRTPYHRDIEYLTFDGRILFAGAEASFRSARRTVRPFVTAGAGVFNDSGAWVQKTIVDPSQPRVHTSVERDYTLAAFTVSGGLDVALSERASLRAGVRLYGLLQTGEGRDLAPHTIIQPGVGVAYRW
jgi:hypothetical protein